MPKMQCEVLLTRFVSSTTVVQSYSRDANVHAYVVVIVDCYKSHSVACTESFYKQNVMEEIELQESETKMAEELGGNRSPPFVLLSSSIA